MWKNIFRSGCLAIAATLIGLLGWAGTAPAAEFWLRADRTILTMPDGQTVPAWGYALTDATFTTGTVQVPGPELAVPPGESLTIHLMNNLPEPTSIVIPGQVADSMAPVRFTDGPFAGRIRSFTAEAAVNGGVQTYSWSSFKAGTFLYQSGSHPGVQVPMGLYGAARGDAAAGAVYPGVPYESAVTLLFSEIDPAQHAAVDSGIYGSEAYPSTLVVGYQPKYFLINGISYSATASPPVPVRGTTLLRFLNAGLRGRMPVVQGSFVRVIAEDGNLKPFGSERYSIDLHAGMTIDAVLEPTSTDPVAIYDRALGTSTAGVGPGGMYLFLQPATTVTLVQPNGGERLTAGTVYSIQWSADSQATGYGLHYSLDNGTTWNLIADVGAVTTLDWTVPAVAGLEGDSLVRVSAYDATGAVLSLDASDAPFTIAPPPVQLLTPNGGETLDAGGVHQIQWNPAISAVTYALHYSLDGTTWSLIEQVGDVTAFDWTVPAVAAPETNTTLQVTAYDASGAILSADQSDAPFTIVPAVVAVQVITPNGGETLTAGDVHAIQWGAATGAAGYRLDYTLDGTNWMLIQQVGAVTSHNWTVPTVTTTQSNCLVRVTALDGAGATLSADQSDAPFTIVPAVVAVQVVTPNGGETLTAGDVHAIQWGAATGAAGYRLDYTLDGTNWMLIQQVGAVTSHNWTVPTVTTTQSNCLVRVTALDGAGATLSADQSDAPFTISPASFALLSPNGGEVLTSGTIHTIRWRATPETTWYRLYYTLNNGVNWTYLERVNTGTTYNWQVPNVTTAQTACQVLIRAYNAAGVRLFEDLSDAPFTVAPPSTTVQVVSPNGGETLVSGTLHTLQWNPASGSAGYGLEYSLDNGTTWIAIAQVGAVTSYNWTVADVTTTQSNCRVRVTALDGSGATLSADQSDGAFTIEPPPAFQVISPNGGETLISGTAYAIQWSVAAGAAGYRLDYTLDGTNWTLIQQVGEVTSQNWTVPAVTMTQSNCLLRVTALDGAGATLSTDQSDAPFTIVPASFAVVSPNGGEVLTSGTVHTIRWSATPETTWYRVYYTLNDGASWTYLGRVETGTTHNWQVPNVTTAQTACRVLVRAYNAAGVRLFDDLSDAPFTVAPAQ